MKTNTRENIKGCFLELLEESPFSHIMGGGAKNAQLNRLTEQFSHKKVIALPIEATALGNLKTQFNAIK